MTALLVVAMFAGFVLLDVLVRYVAARRAQARARRERAAVLETHVRLDFTDEAPSLKRVEVPEPKARILAVDDEPVVLDSFRRILVLAGYSVDTVETGPEALGLVQRHEYDFVFTDLKMPQMDGVEVVKAVRHLRPDVDVAVVTGYATVETAVATMQHGAVDYVQKPFGEDELTEFVRRLAIKREARLADSRRPRVRIISPGGADEPADDREYVVPGGVFVSEGHVWLRIEPSGQVRLGIDDFARKALGVIEKIELPRRGEHFSRGAVLCSLARRDRLVQLSAPVAGKVVDVNGRVQSHPGVIRDSPYEEGWLIAIEPDDLTADLAHLRIGKPIAVWYQDEIERLRHAHGSTQAVEDWARFERQFLDVESETL
jgi:CheY-like chemotaxis protein